MDTLLKYTTSDLANDQVAREVFDLGNSLIEYSKFAKCYDLSKELDDQVNALPSESKLKKDYQNLIDRLRFTSLHLWSNNNTVLQFFENNIAAALRDERINIIERLKFKLTDLPIFDRDEYRQKLIRSLQANRQILTRVSLAIGGKKLAGTITNWLKDYQSAVGGGFVDDIDKVKYLTNSDNVKDLSAEDKISVHRLIDLFEYLKLSSESVEGLEESFILELPDGRKKIVADGEIKDLYGKGSKLPSMGVLRDISRKDFIKKEPSPNVENEVMSAYYGDQNIQQAISVDETKLRNRIKDNIAKLREEFYFSVQSKKTNEAVAAMRLMVEKNDLLNFIQEDKKLSQFLAATWEKQYGKQFADNFRRNPTEVKFVRLFIKYILQQRLDLPENDAARIGMQIGNIFAAAGQKGYNKMAYFDIKTKNFHWFNE